MRGPPALAARGRDFFFGPGGGLTRPYVRAVDVPQVPVDQALVVQVDLQHLDDPGEHAVASPAGEVSMHGLVRPEPRVELPPAGASREDPENAVEHEPRIAGGPARACGA